MLEFIVSLILAKDTLFHNKPESIQEIILKEARIAGMDGNRVLKIAMCESNFDSAAIGERAVVGKDLGLFQINSYFHGDRADELGLDLMDAYDNTKFAVMLMRSEGLKPWKASQHCWAKK